MSTDAWRAGGRAWKRLARRYRDGGSPAPDDDPLAALADVGLVRRLLDEAELAEVRAARRRGRSWAEIAVKLGVTRQSAWERWRDLDDDGPAADGPEPAAAVLDRTTRRLRRATLVAVPAVVGMPFADARSLLVSRGLVGLADDPDAAAPDALGRSPVVTGQSPESGARMPPGTAVRLWTDRGGGAGVREPRRPRPTPPSGYEVREEPAADVS